MGTVYNKMEEDRYRVRYFRGRVENFNLTNQIKEALFSRFWLVEFCDPSPKIPFSIKNAIITTIQDTIESNLKVISLNHSNWKAEK